MIQHVTITGFRIVEVQTKNGPAEKVEIKTNVHERPLSAFMNQYNKDRLTGIKEGTEMDLVVTQNGDFLNFKLPSPNDYLEARVTAIEQHLGITGETPTENNW